MLDEDKKILEEQVAWNLSGQLVEQISALLFKASELFLDGKIPQAFHGLVAVKHRFIQNLNDEDRKRLTLLESYFITIRNSNKLQQYPKIHLGKLTQAYSIYNAEIMDLLEQYGYTIPKTKSIIGME